MDVILASRSPRRRELLLRIFPRFEVVPSGVDEAGLAKSDPVLFAQATAEAKARDVAEGRPDALVIGADTIVVLGTEIFGKPAGRAEAEEMLGKLSGRKHRVITGVALYRKSEDRLAVSYQITYVTFKALAPETIAAYLDAHEYRDKAGSYAIQEIGEAFIEKIEGDYDNVVGFPVKRVRRMLKELAAPETDVEVTGFDFARNWAFGIAEGLKILVPGAVVGDVVHVRLVWRKPRAGKIIKFLTRSPFRERAVCPHFGTCGGCAFQCLRYEKQLELKGEHFEKTIRAAAEGAGAGTDGTAGAKEAGAESVTGLTSGAAPGFEIPGGKIEPMIPSPDAYSYRNKMEFAFCGEAGALKLGLRARTLPGRKTQTRTVPLGRCAIAGDAAELVFPVTLEYFNGTGLSPYDPMSQRGFLRNLVLRDGKTTGEIMVLLVAKSGGGPGANGGAGERCGTPLDAGEWAERLRDRVPRVKSVWRVENDRVADLVDFEKARLLSGTPFIEEELGGLRFRIYPESFFQPNPRAALLFYERIVERARAVGARRALGLYCGPGTIELFLARVVEDVVGIDSEARNIRNGEENALLNGLRNVRFEQGFVEKVLDEKAHAGFDFLVLDPPREGVRAEGMAKILAMAVPQIVYMSCNPATLARDLALLAAGGYRVDKLVCADFFPHTPHMEALAFLSQDG